MKKKKSISITIIFREIIARLDHENMFISGRKVSENLLLLAPEEAFNVLPTYLINLRHNFEIDHLTLVNETNQDIDLAMIFDHAELHLSDFPDIEVIGFRVDQPNFVRIVENWRSVSFSHCDLTSDEWLKPNDNARCDTLYFSSCTTTLPFGERAGIAWRSLKSLFVWENYWNDALHRPDTLRPKRMRSKESHDLGFKAEHGTGLLGPCLTGLSFHRCENIDFLRSVGHLESLNTLSIYLSPCNEAVFNWICHHYRLEEVQLDWASGTKLDWKKLERLWMLKTLEMECRWLNDADLADILPACPRLRHLDIHYSMVSPVSWPKILAQKSLRSITISNDMLKGDIPIDLPARTKLRQILAINSRPGFLPQIAEKYPGLKTASI